MVKYYIVGFVGSQAMLRKIVLRSKDMTTLWIIERSQLSALRIQWRSLIKFYQICLNVRSVYRIIMRWKLLCSPSKITHFSPKKRHWRQKLAPRRRGSSIWRHLAKFWNHQLHQELRQFFHSGLFFVWRFAGDGEFNNCDIYSISVTSHTFDHKGVCGEFTTLGWWSSR